MSALLKTLQLARQEGLSPDLRFSMSLALIPNSSSISNSYAAIKRLKKIVHTAAETPGNLLDPVRRPHTVKCSGSALVPVLLEAGQWASSLSFYDSPFLCTPQS